ncbi:hypothetical protein CCUS01_11476 [Colletotrichum cuscutae]|uniref:Uncharacterized protein n=1 Tax=Colletotrichum cuscutae TaxID=1209917 RepID=A0AAI9XHK5_9PEZI|nr:hypothetical protein CCUS01_11476 [Colletotrichum cuscutae]
MYRVSFEAYSECGVIGPGTRMNQPRRCLVVPGTQEGRRRALRKQGDARQERTGDPQTGIRLKDGEGE